MANWQVVSEHRRTLTGMLQTSWPFLLLGAMAAGFAAMFMWIWTSRQHTPDMLIASGVCVFLTLGLLGATAWKAFLSASPVQVFEEGLNWRQDGRERQRSWDEVREVYRKELYRLQNGARPSDWNRHSELRLVFTDGEEAKFNHSLSDYNRLAEFVQQKTAERLLPLARKEFDGRGVAFGPLRLGREGLSLGHELFAWPTLTGLRVRNGFLSWNGHRGADRFLPLKDLPNYPVLLQLLDEVLSSAGKS
jgi:hypothetical protein